MEPGDLRLEGPFEKALYLEAALGIGANGHASAPEEFFEGVAYAGGISRESRPEVRYAVYDKLA